MQVFAWHMAALWRTSIVSPNRSSTTTVERDRFDSLLASQMPVETREAIWCATDDILNHGPLGKARRFGATGLALGYVQSGKTTSITALMASAADQGYSVVVALLGSTNILLDQNTRRIEDALIEGRKDYRWISLPNAKGASSSRAINDWLAKRRVVFLPILKHAGRIKGLATALQGSIASDRPVLIIDDEGDQASLNVATNERELSRTYEALASLRAAVPQHLYVQYTATPYAPLLLDLGDKLRPDFVTLLHPGPNYTGGREFFVDEASRVIRPIPPQDEQAAKSLPLSLPKSLVPALANFLLGAATLLALPEPESPVSMLIHSTQRNDVQSRYHFLVVRQVDKWRESIRHAQRIDDLPHVFRDEYERLLASGAEKLDEADLMVSLKRAAQEATVWLINSSSAAESMDWQTTPVHILIGGNKLDRGFTVEGLTVTYMNRPASNQIDTLEQRARAFGYRSRLLPYCQFFASPQTLEILRGIVFTEYDLRANLRDVLDEGGTVHTWATQIGLLLPQGTKPSRPSVISNLNSFNPAGTEWHSLRRPSLVADDMRHNESLVEDLELPTAPRHYYGRLAFPTRPLPLSVVIDDLLDPWALSSYSPGWRKDDLLAYLRRAENPGIQVPVAFMDDQTGGPRVRAWDELGFVNLFQGRDLTSNSSPERYEGDRNVPIPAEETGIALQVHYVSPRERPEISTYTLAIKLSGSKIVRKADRR